MVAMNNCGNSNQGSSFGIILGLLLIVFLMLGGFIFISNQSENLLLFEESPHANEKHGSEAELVRNSCNNGGIREIWYNPSTGRDAKICSVILDGNKKWGIRIMYKNDEITAFVKNKMDTIEQVRKYLSNQGYIPK